MTAYIVRRLLYAILIRPYLESAEDRPAAFAWPGVALYAVVHALMYAGFWVCFRW